MKTGKIVQGLTEGREKFSKQMKKLLTGDFSVVVCDHVGTGFN